MASTVSFKACPCCAGTGIRPSARGSARIVASATPKDGERARRVDVFYLLNNPDPPWTFASLSRDEPLTYRPLTFPSQLLELTLSAWSSSAATIATPSARPHPRMRPLDPRWADARA